MDQFDSISTQARKDRLDRSSALAGRSTFWLVANAHKLAGSLCTWLNRWLEPVFDLERAQLTGDILARDLASISRHCQLSIFRQPRALGTPLTVDPSWLQRQEGALRALQVATGTVGQREQGLRSEGAVVDKKQVLAMMMHIFRGGQLLQNQLFTGHWRYDGYVCHFSVYDTTRVYQRAYQQLGLGPTTSIQEAFRQAASKVPELNLVPKNSLAPATLSADKIVLEWT